MVNLITGNTIKNEVGTKADAFGPMIKFFTLAVENTQAEVTELVAA